MYNILIKVNKILRTITKSSSEEKIKKSSNTAFSLMIYSFIISTILSQVAQLILPDDNQSFLAYFYVYVFSFLPILLVMILSFFYKELRSWKIFSNLFTTYNIVFHTMALISYFNVRDSGQSVTFHYINIYKYFVIYVLQTNRFNLLVIAIYIFQLIIFTGLIWITKNSKKSTIVYKIK